MRIAKCLYVTRDLATRRENAQKKSGSCSNLTMFGFLLCARRREVTLPSSCKSAYTRVTRKNSQIK